MLIQNTNKKTTLSQKFMKAPANLLMASKIFKRLAVVFPEQQKSRQPEH